MRDRQAFLDGLVSKPWTGEDHCWAFVRLVRKELFACEALPIFASDLVADLPGRFRAFASHPARAEWEEVDAPRDGDVVIMTRGPELHAGIYLVAGGRGHVWHSDRPHGVIWDTLMELTQLRRWKPAFFRRRT